MGPPTHLQREGEKEVKTAAEKMKKSSGKYPGYCTFCQIVKREVKSYSVFEDDTSLAFLDSRPLFPGHTLLVTKKHYQTLADLPNDAISPLFSNVQFVVAAVSEATASDGSFVAINNNVSQSVPHLHVHIVPRRRNDGLRGFFWPRQRYSNEEAILEVQNAIRSVVTRMHERMSRKSSSS